MGRLRGPKGLITIAACVGAFGLAGTLVFGGTQAKKPVATAAAKAIQLWAHQDQAGDVTLKGEVPLPVARQKAEYLRHHPAGAMITVNFGLPIKNMTAINGLIAQEAQTHHYISRTDLYNRFSPPQTQLDALRHWLQGNGFKVTHVGLDRLSIAATATTAQVEQALHVKINDYVSPGYKYEAVKVNPYVFFANTTSPKVPARFGLQSISGLSDVDRFFTQIQLDQAAAKAQGGKSVIAPIRAGAPAGCDTGDDSSDSSSDPDTNGGAQCILTRGGGGYYPSDLRTMYDVTGHINPATGTNYDGTGQTLGFTLWGAGEEQTAQTLFAQDTGEPAIQVQTPCVASGNSPSSPSSCVSQTAGANQLINILENGNTNNNFAGNDETALDIEQAHGEAPNAGLKYYLSDCESVTPPGSGLTNASCNGSDVGMEEAIEDAANDRTLHTVSNSWAFGGEAEWGAADPFFIASENSLAIAAAAGTTFYFSTGASGSFQSGYPSDSPYVVSVGGTTLFTTAALPTGTTGAVNTTTGVSTVTGAPGGGTPVLSTENTWAAGGSWCSNIIARPSWQSIAAVNNAAPCPGRVIPDVSAVADTNTSVLEVDTTNTGFGTSTGGVGGTSVAAPEMNGLEADTENFIAAQTYPGPKPAIGFEGPVIYALGAANSNAYFRDVLCGNTASPGSSPDGDAAQPGWDPATGWGAPDWFHFATGYAMQLGATGLSVPSSDSQNYSWTCAKTPSNSSERSISFPSSTVGFAVGAASGTTPWPAKFLPSGSWGAVNTFFQTSDGGATWVPSNSDMLSVACTSTSACVEVGDGGVIKTTSNSGATWTAVSSGDDKALTQVACPGSGVCYAAGDRGIVLKSTDSGQTWSYLQSTDGNPIYGLSCPTTSTCYATDIYAHVIKTSDGGATWTWQSTPITTPGLAVPGSGGPNPYGGLMSISCSSASTCVATGLYAIVSGQALPSSDPPIITTTNGGTTWTLQTSNAGGTQSSSTTLAAATLVNAVNIKVASVSGLTIGQSLVVDSTGANPETVTLTSVGTSGASGTGLGISPALAFAHSSGATVSEQLPNFLHGVTCLPSTTTCVAVGRNGAIVSTTNLTTWTKATSGTTNVLTGITCVSATSCIATGQNGTVDVLSGTTWTASTGNAASNFLASVSCPGSTTCYTAGKQGVTIGTTNLASWTQQAGGGTTQQMNSVSCPAARTCFAVGNAGTILATTNGGQTWLPQTSNTTSNLAGISCWSTTACVTVGAVSSGTAQTRYTTDGSTWQTGFPSTSNIALNGVACVTGLCTAVGASGVIVDSTNGGVNWSSQTSGTSTSLSAVACPSATSCYADGAVVSGSAVMLKETSGTWAPQTSNSTQALSALACVDSQSCVAGGAAGAVVQTADGSTWTPQGNPLSGPVTALDTVASSLIAINGAGCSPARCAFGTASSGDILDSPLQTVTVVATATYGSTPPLSGLAPTATGISYSVAGQSGNLGGTLTCTTTATNMSPVGVYPITGCSGLTDSGFSVDYNYGASSYTITKAPLTVTADPQSRQYNTANPTLTATLSGFVLGQSLGTSGVTGSAACTTTAVQLSAPGGYPITCTVGTLASTNYSFATFTPGTLTVTFNTVVTGSNSKVQVSSGQAVQIEPGAVITGTLNVRQGGYVDVEGGSMTSLSSDGAVTVVICGGTFSSDVSVKNGTGPGNVTIGGPSCGSASFGASLSVQNNAGAVTVENETVHTTLTVSGNTAGVTVTGNHVTSDTSVTQNTGGATVTGNTIGGGLTVKTNFGTVVDHPNTVTGTSNLQ